MPLYLTTEATSRSVTPLPSPGAAALVNRVGLAEGDPVYFEGDQAENWYEVIAGSVCATKLWPDGRRQVIEFYVPGDAFGFDDDNGLHTLSAEAASETRTVIARHRRARLRGSAAAEPSVASRMHDLAMRALVRSRDRIQVLGRPSALERVAAFFIEMSERLSRESAPNGARTYTLPMSRRDIADYLAITPETLSRCSQQLRRQGGIGLPNHKEVTILDPGILAAAAAGGACAEPAGACLVQRRQRAA